MKIINSFCLLLSLTALCPTLALGAKADPFKGKYQIVSEHDKSAADADYFLLDADTLGAIWAKYADTPLPPDLEKYRSEPSIIAGFTNRDLIFLTLEKGALIVNGYLSIEGGNGERLEIKKRPDGQSDMAVKEGNRVTLYVLSAPEPIP
jgi:hypothetical protein